MGWLKTAKTSAALLVAGFVAASCGAGNQTIGAVRGGTFGGFATSQFGGGAGQITAASLGALEGGIVGGDIGSRLDAKSRKKALRAEYNALESAAPGQAVSWQGSNGAYGRVTPQQTYQVGQSNCRRYKHSVFVDGSSHEASGTACRNADGIWTPLT